MAATAAVTINAAITTVSSSPNRASTASFLSRPTFISRASLNGALATSASAVVKVLEEKSVSELRLLAKERGLRGDTKSELVKLLASSAPSPNGAVAPSSVTASTPTAIAFDAKQLERLSIGELRAIARARGVFGASKKELISELLKYSAPVSAPTPPAPVVSSVASSSSYEAQLQAQPLSALRAIARQKGVKGESKAAIIKALLNVSTGGTVAAPPAYATPVTSYDSAPVPVTTTPAASSLLKQQLQSRPLSLLRALARQKGLKGDTREQLIAALTGESPSSSASLNAAVLAGKTVAELRALAKEKGIRGDTKSELIQLLLAAQ